MVDRFEVSFLMDYYLPLLTEKQQNIMEMYYNEDLSLAEIAEINKTSRQAIHDLIKRCEKQLLAYENKLNLLQKSLNREKKIIRLLENLRKKHSINEEEYDMLKEELEDL
ncbi:putative DNA-binding protein [uncultured Clostridium sp.]|uniref:putative DNA-binding protein n=1 Tax=uncultured Clostridium sp. TaxID=59620 RepID=UPI002634B8CA|nr:putative DNA-binding protein [uncultured Clostridium sp.]